MWTMVAHKNISWEHCGRPAYWEGDDVYCSKCQSPLIDSDQITEGE
jgi:hypothetical protein